MKYQLRIIAGILRGRKVTVTHDAALRPLADRAREALFSILGDLVPGRPFYDVFAGSGAVGLEALSRGASTVTFVEREPQAVGAILQHLRAFGVADKARVLRADAYRWGDKWAVPTEPVNVFLGPPYEEFERHRDAVQWLIQTLQRQCPAESALIVQSDRQFDPAMLPDAERWDMRHYGRTQLGVWFKPAGERSQESGDRSQESENQSPPSPDPRSLTPDP